MKNLRFLSGLILGFLLALSCLIIIKCKTDDSDQIQKVPDTFSVIQDLSKGSGGSVYKLTIDNIQYIVVEAPNGGVAIAKHQ